MFSAPTSLRLGRSLTSRNHSFPLQALCLLVRESSSFNPSVCVCAPVWTVMPCLSHMLMPHSAHIAFCRQRGYIKSCRTLQLTSPLSFSQLLVPESASSRVTPWNAISARTSSVTPIRLKSCPISGQRPRTLSQRDRAATAQS